MTDSTVKQTCIGLITRQAAIGLIALTGLAQPALAQTQLSLANISSEKGFFNLVSRRFAAKLEAVSKGQLTVAVEAVASKRPLSTLWKELRSGAVDFHVVTVGAVVMNPEAKALNVMYTPFLFRDQQHYRNYLRSDLFRQSIAEVERSTGIGFVGQLADVSPRVITTRDREIRTASDVRGLKIRIPNNPIFASAFKAWGAEPVKMGMRGLVEKIRAGELDGQDNGALVFVRYKAIHPVQKHFAPINWAHTGVGLFVNAASWKRLTDQQRQWVTEAVNASQLESQKTHAQAMTKALAALPGAGVNLDRPDVDSFHGATIQVVKEYEGTMWPAGMVNRIRAVR